MLIVNLITAEQTQSTSTLLLIKQIVHLNSIKTLLNTTMANSLMQLTTTIPLKDDLSPFLIYFKTINFCIHFHRKSLKIKKFNNSS